MPLRSEEIIIPLVLMFVRGACAYVGFPVLPARLNSLSTGPIFDAAFRSSQEMAPVAVSRSSLASSRLRRSSSANSKRVGGSRAGEVGSATVETTSVIGVIVPVTAHHSQMLAQ